MTLESIVELRTLAVGAYPAVSRTSSIVEQCTPPPPFWISA